MTCLYASLMTITIRDLLSQTALLVDNADAVDIL
jgi:hypothetical protein